MTNSPIVHVPLAELDQFKRASHNLFEIVARISGCPSVPKRRGLNILSQAFGYTSHPDLVRQAPGYTTGREKRFELLPDDALEDIADNLAKLLPHLGIQQAKDALLRMKACTTPAPTMEAVADVIGNLNHLADEDYNRVINRFHAAWAMNDLEAIERLVCSVSVRDLESKSTAELLSVCSEKGLTTALQHLLDQGVSPDLTLMSKQWESPLASAIRKDQVECQLLLIKYGADINCKTVANYRYSLAHYAIECSAHTLIRHCIDSGLLRHEPGLLRFAVVMNDLSVVVQIYRISDTHDKLAAIEASLAQASYFIALMMRLDRDLVLSAPIEENISGAPILPRLLYGTLACIACFPTLAKKLSPCKVAFAVFNAIWFYDDSTHTEWHAKLIDTFLLSEESPWHGAVNPVNIRSLVELASNTSLIVMIMLILTLKHYKLNESVAFVERYYPEWDIEDHFKKTIHFALDPDSNAALETLFDGRVEAEPFLLPTAVD